MRNIKIASIIALATIISGCASLVSQTTDQPISASPGLRTAGTVIDDEVIENKILINLTKASDSVKKSHINVISFNENVLLVGQVPSEEARIEAGDIAQSTRKVKSVHNELLVAGPTSLLIRSNDTYLTSHAKISLLASQNANGIRIKVITENGTVFLMGLLKRSEAQSAVDEIVTISGVRKIVKVFEYID
ncbi:MAG: osmotically-inducible protein OsmY [Oceanospirillaceae bacterium]|jgi:osmotically-inducible protein OsmY